MVAIRISRVEGAKTVAEEVAGERKSLQYRGVVPVPAETPDVTVIVPCYNVERFIDQCLGSIAANDRIRLEVIVVNDGSKDATLSKARAFAAADPRFHVVDKPNGGYGMGVNIGFENAHGTYVAIVEPDDWVDPHFYDELMEYARTFDELPQIVKTPYTRVVFPETRKERTFQCAYYKRLDVDRQPFTLHENPRLIQHHPSIWSAMYLRSFIDGCGIRMFEVPGAGWVDNPFLVETLCQATSIAYLEKPFYNYREDLPGSSSMLKATDLAFRRWNDMTAILKRLEVDDPEIWRAHYIRGFAYISGILDEGDIAGTEVERMMREMFGQMDPDLVLTAENVTNEMKGMFVRVRGLNGATYDKGLYRRALVDEFMYSWRTNGLGFAMSRIWLYIARKMHINAHDPTKTKSAGI